MSSKWRRFEVLLPLQFNDGREVPAEWLAVLSGFLLLWAVMNFRVVPREERDLEARFGEPYLQYKSGVARWFGKTRP